MLIANFTTNFFYHIPVLQKMQIYLKVFRVIGSSDYSILILRYVYSNVALIAILRLCQAFINLLLIVNLKAHNDQFSDNQPFLFLLSHRSLHAQYLPESLHCWFTRMSFIFIEATPESEPDKYLLVYFPTNDSDGVADCEVWCFLRNQTSDFWFKNSKSNQRSLSFSDFYRHTLRYYSRTEKFQKNPRKFKITT